MVLKLVIFDLDGTLVTAEINFKAMRQAIRDVLKSQGIPEEAMPMNSTQELLRSAFEYERTQGKSAIEISRIRDQVYAAAVELEWEGAKKAQLVPGVQYTLAALKKRKVQIAVLTNDNREVANYLLAKFELTDYVDGLISRDDAPHMKPATEGLELILNKFKVSPNETIFVGDSTIDVMTANKRGIRCIGRLSKMRTEEELRKEGAVAVFSDLTPLISYLEEQKLLLPQTKE